VLPNQPPVPEGKRASVSAQQYYGEFESAQQSASVGESSIVWSFSPNPRTNTNFSYSQKYDANYLDVQRRNDTEGIRAALNYGTPGGKSTYNLELVEETVTGQSASRNVRKLYNLNTNVNLGPAASLNMFYNQLYSDNYGSAFTLPDSNDQTVSGVRYAIRGSGLDLSATWQLRQSRFERSGIRKSYEEINLNLRYQTQAKWIYNFNVQSKANAEAAAAAPLGYNYTTDDTITVTVSYQF
jgi:hypothetical protein